MGTRYRFWIFRPTGEVRKFLGGGPANVLRLPSLTPRPPLEERCARLPASSPR
jgi:hypothetical protein